MSDPRVPYDGTEEQQRRWNNDYDRARFAARGESRQESIDNQTVSAVQERSTSSGCALVLVGGSGALALAAAGVKALLRSRGML